MTVEVGMGVGCIQVAAGLEKSGGWIGASRGAAYGLESWAQSEESIFEELLAKKYERDDGFEEMGSSRRTIREAMLDQKIYC